MAYIVMAYMVMAYIVMAYIAMAVYAHVHTDTPPSSPRLVSARAPAARLLSETSRSMPTASAEALHRCEGTYRY